MYLHLRDGESTIILQASVKLITLNVIMKKRNNFFKAEKNNFGVELFFRGKCFTRVCWTIILSQACPDIEYFYSETPVENAGGMRWYGPRLESVRRRGMNARAMRS